MSRLGVEPTVRWLFFNAILALLPLIIPYAAAKLMKVEAHWSRLLKDGELFIFSTTISASSIGALLFQRMTPNQGEPSATASGTLANTLTICSLLMILILSTAYFTIASYLKLKEQPLPDERLYSAGSVAAAVVSVLLGYVTYVQVG